MRHIHAALRAILWTLVWSFLWASASMGAPVAYDLNIAKSESAFIYRFENNPVRGTIPVISADVAIDFDNLANSTVRTTLSAQRATAGFVFATQTVRGPQMLNAAAFPTIHFVSTSVRGTLPTATISGTLTLRGVTRPVTLRANLFRQSNSMRNLVIRLQGKINRNDFGMSGFPGFVGPIIDLDIQAHITRR